MVPRQRGDPAGQPGSAVGAVLVVCGAGGDRDLARAGVRCPRDRQACGAVAVDDLAGVAPNAATRGGGLAYRAVAAQWHAAQRARRPKMAKLAANQALREYVQDRLAGSQRHSRRSPSPVETDILLLSRRW
jgi:hypothetical protein